MKQIEKTLQDLKCMLIEDGYTEANIVLRTLIKAQEQVKNDGVLGEGNKRYTCLDPDRTGDCNDLCWEQCEECKNNVL